MFVVCCQVEVFATSWTLIQRSPTDCGALLCVIMKPHERGGHSPHWASKPEKKKSETGKQSCTLKTFHWNDKNNVWHNCTCGCMNGWTARWTWWLQGDYCQCKTYIYHDLLWV
jgi:hypothetical protein